MSGAIHDLVFDRAAEDPDAVAVVDCDGTSVTYTAQRAAIEAMAERFADAGLGRGDRLVLVAENCHAATVAIFAASLCGAIAVPVNARLSAPELARIVDHAGPRAIVYTTDISAEARDHAEAAGAGETETGLALAKGSGGGAAAAEGTAVILYTTGTTGAPKGVMLTHANLRFAGKTSAELRGMTPADIIYGVLPMTHVFGLASMLMAANHAGSTIRLEARFAADRLHAALRDGVTVFPGVPQMHALLMAHLARTGGGRLEGSALRYVSSGAAPLDPAWKRKAEAFYGLPLQNGYGMTESTAGICGTRNPIGLDDISVGPALPGIEIALDETKGGGEVGVGEILSRGPHIMAGYYRAPDLTAQTIDAEGWLRTGDLSRIDGEGRLHVVGRCKELIIRGGFNVYPPEVEAALNDHPDVVQCAVIGRAAGGDEEILAFVQCADPKALDPATLRAFAAERLAPYKRPTHIILARTLPAAPTGKILKHWLTQVFADRLAQIGEMQ
ncbi:class I adenylate-forming enzyme family protein [Jannaschia aquimarina]|uniref:LcfB_1 protein n=1 Tax=Jannaschia aquimarina TaxID=935700 RepID=A0A0D1EQI1_9RHOB|nr:class I adenylate-forming enzyme family protein [Jannaschia aquimarina]KIT17860.1 Long-chain-fatty-acid--CoA ligase [Jannaschia aquimarina]SNS56225.1 Acyl-CoA synthetase (AMP-forming)/AMP-acid ligase II [Jannaschia aquimarina]